MNFVSAMPITDVADIFYCYPKMDTFVHDRFRTIKLTIKSEPLL